jgi:hypothetical protein
MIVAGSLNTKVIVSWSRMVTDKHMKPTPNLFYEENQLMLME